MKQYFILTLFLCLVPMLQAQEVPSRIDFLIDRLYDHNSTDYVMIFAHRGDWRNAPENSLLAYQNCIDANIDGIEIDIQETKDKELIVLHDETLDRTTTGKGNIKELTLFEIKQLQLKNAIGIKTRHKIPTYREVLQLCKGKVLIQVDKWQKYRKKVLKIAEEEGCLNQIILRGTTTSTDAKKLLGDYWGKVLYIPVLVAKGGEYDNLKLDDYLKNMDTPIISLSFKSDTCRILNRIDDIKNAGCRLWLNSMWASFNGGHDDEMAEYNLDNSYGWLLQKGGSIILSDRPFLLNTYLKKRKYR